MWNSLYHSPLGLSRQKALRRERPRRALPKRPLRRSGHFQTIARHGAWRYNGPVARAARVRFHLDRQSTLSVREQIREQLVQQVHLGVLSLGTRLPSVRDLAAQTGLNLKTAFRIYRRLAQQHLVDIRPQKGVFVKVAAGAAQRSYRNGLAVFLQRVLRESKRHNLSPHRLAHLLVAKAGVRHAQAIRCAVLECNREQTDLFSEELRRALNVDAFPVLTCSSPQRRNRALKQADVLITTDFHWEEATRWAAQHHKELYRIRLNPAFHRLLVRHARRGLFPMILTDVSFESRFRRALAATVAPAVLERLVFVHCRDHSRLREVLTRARRAYVSPLCYPQVAKQAPKNVRLITLHQMVSSESLRALRHCLFPLKNAAHP